MALAVWTGTPAGAQTTTGFRGGNFAPRGICQRLETRLIVTLTPYPVT